MTLPHNQEAEDATLGAVIVNPFLFSKVNQELTADDFYTQNARQVYSAMVHLDNAAVEINQRTIIEHVKNTGMRVPTQYVLDLNYGIPMMQNIDRYLFVLKGKSALRHMAKIGESIIARAMDNDEPIDLLGDAEQSLLEIRKRIGFAGRSFRSFNEVDANAGNEIERLHKGDSSAVLTGFKSLDFATRGGNQPGDVWVIAALTGRGKSSWALGAARAQAVAGIPVAFVSREMSEFENYIRVLAGASQVPVWRVKPGMFPDTYYSLQEWRPFTATLPIWINTKTSNIFEIRSQVRELVRTKAIRSLFIDYLQLLSVSPDSKMSSRAQEVATVSRVLKEIAMENQIAVFALAQFNRYAAHGEQPELHHLAESSGIEKDASLVLILDMEKQKDKDPNRECEMRIAKHRNGPCLSLKYRYRGDVLTFEEAA
jgi:replicative DNA helicase